MEDQDDEIAARLRENWLLSVFEISDLDLQRRTWLDLNNRNPHWSYIEFVCCYPEIDQLTNAYSRGWLSTREFEIFLEFRKTLLAYSPPNEDEYNHDAILADPAWHRVIMDAQLARLELLSPPS